MKKDELEALYKTCRNNRSEIERLGRFACFSCEGRYAAAEVAEWIGEGKTALCPCWCDACLPDDGTITDEMLCAMEAHYFGRAHRVLSSKTYTDTAGCVRNVVVSLECGRRVVRDQMTRQGRKHWLARSKAARGRLDRQRAEESKQRDEGGE